MINIGLLYIYIYTYTSSILNLNGAPFAKNVNPLYYRFPLHVQKSIHAFIPAYVEGNLVCPYHKDRCAHLAKSITSNEYILYRSHIVLPNTEGNTLHVRY